MSLNEVAALHDMLIRELPRDFTIAFDNAQAVATRTDDPVDVQRVDFEISAQHLSAMNVVANAGWLTLTLTVWLDDRADGRWVVVQKSER